MALKDRYCHVPQMELYDSLMPHWVPYLMFFNRPNYYSDILNVDSYGFRFSGPNGKQRLDRLNKSSAVSIFSGGSTAFGIGATSDSATIPAILSKKTDQLWMNFGGRAHVSTQEWISFMTHRAMVGSIENIVIFSGINDLLIYFLSNYFNKQMGSFFSASHFFECMKIDNRYRSLLFRPIINRLLSFFYGNYDFTRVSNTNALKLLFRKRSITDPGLNDIKEGFIQEHSEKPQEVIDILKRSISNWKMAADHYNARVIYILQPFSNWLNERTLSKKEVTIFSILDAEQSFDWKGVSGMINSLQDWYSGELRKVCDDENIEFYDSNEAVNSQSYSGVSIFVDRIHLTDNGNMIMSDYIVSKI
jgi:hypothetical protein